MIVSDPQKVTFNHKQLGELTGWLRGNTVIQFRGIPYASLPGRFRQSVLNTILPRVPFDATNPGKSCPHPPSEFWPIWNAPLPADYPRLATVEAAEFECLNLDLTIPRRGLDGCLGRKMPVLVYIHGGAFVNGNHAAQLHGREIFDAYNVVRRSMELDKDIIVATINYRVGPLGFLAGEQLAQFNRAHDEPACNYGLHDQARAFDWVWRFVSHFGGDADNITILGTSAGAASCHYQCAFPNRRFKRAILASGTAMGIGALTLESHQQEFDRVAKGALGPETSGSSSRTLEQLSSCLVEDLTDKVPFVLCHPYIDGVFIRGNSIYDMFANVQDPPDIMVGAAAREDDVASVLLSDFDKETLTMRPATDHQISAQLESMFASSFMLAKPHGFPFEYPEIMDLYNLNDSAQHPSTDIDRWVRLLADVVFNFPTIYTALVYNEMFAREKQGKAWLFQFDAKDPYSDLSASDTAHHGVNDIFFFDVAPDAVPPQKFDNWSRTSKNVQRIFIEFTNGNSPYRTSVVPGNGAETDVSIGAFGPLYIFDDGDRSRVEDTVQDVLGDLGVKRCDAVLSASRF